MGQEKKGLIGIIGRLLFHINIVFPWGHQKDSSKEFSGDFDFDVNELSDKVTYELPETIEPKIEKIYDSEPSFYQKVFFYGDP